MPLYIRNRQLDIPTPTISSVASEDEADNYINDPQQIFDELPMPFRLINKILDKIIEDSWEDITRRQVERDLDAKRIKPPQHNPNATHDQFVNATCINAHLSNHVFIAHSNKLSLKTLENNFPIDWQPEREICIEHISCERLDPNTIVLGIIDDMGFGKLLVFAEGMFHFVKSMNEHLEGTEKSNLTVFDFSSDGEYCTCALESGGESWLEVHSIPKDNWIKEIENAKKDFVKKSESNIDVSQTEQSDPTEATVTPSASAENMFPDIKFSPLTVALKVKCPPKLTPASIKCAQDALDEVSKGDVLGRGYVHGITDKSLKIQDAMFNHLHEEDMIYFEEENMPTPTQPHFHFLKGSCMEQGTLYTKPGESVFQSIAIWWTKSNNLSFYSLTKTGKDVEFKPDSVLPQTSSITCTSLSQCGNYLAIGLQNGALSVWDREFGTPIYTSLDRSNVIKYLGFISGYSQSMKHDMPNSMWKFEQRKTVTILVGYDSGEVINLEISSGFNSQSKIRTIINSSTEFVEKFQYLTVVSNIPEILLKIQNNGEIFFLDNSTGQILCKLVMDNDYICDLPKTSNVNISSSYELYIIGTSTFGSGQKLCSFSLEQIESVLSYIKLHKNVNADSKTPQVFMDCVQELLTQRIAGQNDRTAILAARWHSMTKQLGFLLDLKENVAISRKSHNKSNSSGSRWSKTTSRLIADKKRKNTKAQVH